MSQTIEAEQRRLGQIFSDAYDFIIPPYQRPYAWATEQTSALLDDLQTASEAKEIEDMPPYFLGSIVIIKKKEKALSEVIDGQQRLTTLTILLCVLRELIEDDGVRDALDERVVAKGDALRNVEDRMRLQLRDRDEMFFREKIQSKGHLKNSCLKAHRRSCRIARKEYAKTPAICGINLRKFRILTNQALRSWQGFLTSVAIWLSFPPQT